jgi:hypothetical protein
VNYLNYPLGESEKTLKPMLFNVPAVFVVVKLSFKVYSAFIVFGLEKRMECGQHAAPFAFHHGTRHDLQRQCRAISDA